MSSSVNQNFKTPPLNMGVIVPPNQFNKPVLYSHEKATRDFNRLDHDIYVSMKNTKGFEKRKTPNSVYWALGILTLGIGYLLLRRKI